MRVPLRRRGNALLYHVGTVAARPRTRPRCGSLVPVRSGSARSRRSQCSPSLRPFVPPTGAMGRTPGRSCRSCSTRSAGCATASRTERTTASTGLRRWRSSGPSWLRRTACGCCRPSSPPPRSPARRCSPRSGARTVFRPRSPTAPARSCSSTRRWSRWASASSVTSGSSRRCCSAGGWRSSAARGGGWPRARSCSRACAKTSASSWRSPGRSSPAARCAAATARAPSPPARRPASPSSPTPSTRSSSCRASAPGRRRTSTTIPSRTARGRCSPRRCCTLWRSSRRSRRSAA